MGDKMPKISESYEAHTSKINAVGNLLSAEITYIVTECAGGEESALDAVRAYVPKSFRNIPLSYLEIASKDANDAFHVTAVYEETASEAEAETLAQTDTPSMSFSCGGGTKHVTTAIYQTHYGTHSAYNSIKLIGWNGKTGADMQVAGVDVPTAQMREDYVRIMKYREVIDTKFRRKVGSLSGFVNKDTFHGWNPGEVMFLDASFTTPLDPEAKVPVTFHFAIQTNERKTVEIGGTATTITKKGFEYVWILPKTSVKNGVPVLEIDDFFVAGVIEARDFSVLGV